MLKRLFVYSQYVLPQHLLTQLVGKLANCRITWVKKTFIRLFMKQYRVDLSEAQIEDPSQFATFNDFFIRRLKPTARPIANDPHAIVSPADGVVCQIGTIQHRQLLQAKGFDFDLENLLGGDITLATTFENGTFATIYLAPHNYHRVHMPFAGQLEKTIYVPGKLFSVNQLTSACIPGLFSRNERFISIFNTDAGPMAVILVGAMIVGSIQTVWQSQPFRAKNIVTTSITDKISLAKGEEVGHFQLGSTVIVLFSKDAIAWDQAIKPNMDTQMGQVIGRITTKICE